MQLFSSYHILSWAIVSIALIALMGFYVASLRSTVRRQASIIRSMQRQLQNLLASSPVDDGASFRKRSSNGMQIGDVADQALHVLDAEQELFVKTTLYMKEHAPFINPDLRIDDLAKALCTNRTTLANCIKKYTSGDLTLLQYINHFRIDYAVQLLADPKNKQTISQIAEAAGYRSRSVFNRQFALIYHCSPSVFGRILFARQRERFLLIWKIRWKNRQAKRIRIRRQLPGVSSRALSS